MNCIWIIVLLFCMGNHGKDTLECGCRTERGENCDRECTREDWTDRRDSCDRECTREDWTDRRDNYDKECSRNDWETRKENQSDCRVDNQRRRSAFDDWEDNVCPCRREFDYYQAEMKDVEEKSER